MGTIFDSSVFINCPYDEEYRDLLRALLFVLKRLGLEPRLASERFNSAEPRMEKICELIPLCKFSIHDLSRTAADPRTNLARMNMPFELGIDWGWDLAERNRLKLKVGKLKAFLILEELSGGLKTAASDLGQSDFKTHGSDPRLLTQAVRAFFWDKPISMSKEDFPDPSILWKEFNDFMAGLQTRRNGSLRPMSDIIAMEPPEFLHHASAWLVRQA